MARREAAVRVQLDGSTDAVVTRSGVHLLRGRETVFLSDRAMNTLAAEWDGRRATFEALNAALRRESDRTAPEPPEAPDAAEAG